MNNSATNYVFGRKYGKSLFLDLYPNATIAFSLRKLKRTYTGYAVQVRRSSDGALLNIGFDALGNLDTSTLLSFIGSSNAYVRTWYDQSGNGKNLINTTNVTQPLLVNAGSIYLTNGKPSILCNGAFLNNNDVVLADATDIMTGFVIAEKKGVGSIINVMNSTGYYHFGVTSTPSVRFRHNSTTVVFNETIANGTQNLFTINRYSIADFRYYRNGTLKNTIAMPGPWRNKEFSIGKSTANVAYPDSVAYQEIIYYSNDKFSDISAIHSNINAHYNIY